MLPSTALLTLFAQDPAPTAPVQQGSGLHGYIAFQAEQPPDRAAFGMGIGFYSAVWPLVDEPLAGFQIGLASTWIQPDNRDNRDVPLAPEGTRARQWAERGPTWDTVFQTVEGGLGYWAGNRFRYGPPKFSMNATPQCYDYEVGSPGWSFFYDTEALPDHRLGIAQLSNRLLIPPDALPFAGAPAGQFLGYTYLALPFTDPVPAKGGEVPAKGGNAPTGDQAWTCFLAAKNFQGPIAYYIPETWSKIADVCRHPFLHGRGLDTRAGLAGGGAMEINTVPQLVATAPDGTRYSKIPRLSFPVDAKGRAVLVQDVTYYARSALYDAFLAFRRGGALPSGRFDPKGAFVAKLRTKTPRFDQDRQPIEGVANTFDTEVFADGTWGLSWREGGHAPRGQFPQYYRHEGGKRVAVAEAAVPEGTGLRAARFRQAKPGQPFTSPGMATKPGKGAWGEPGPASAPLQVRLVDGSLVTYRWYRFIDQPSFQQYRWSEAKKAALQGVVEALHRAWPIDGEYMPKPTHGELVALDPALLVTPPPGMQVGYVPIVVRQERAP